MAGPRILAIESSCDETGVAVVVGGRRIEANQVATQIALHAQTGGIVPEVAARQQLRWIAPTMRAALEEADSGWDELDAGGGEPLPAEPPFPLLCLVVSGGHTQLVLMEDHGRYRLLGQTADDAAGEAFDKVGRLLGLPYPGGPAISAAAAGATPATRFPRARTDGPYDFSFSGLKTAVLREVAAYRDRDEPIPVDGLAAAFEEAVVDALATKTVTAARDHGVAAVALGGGVAANRSLRMTLDERLAADGLPLLVPPPAWCTDNGAMIGAAAGFRLAAGDRAGPDLEAIPNLALPWLTPA